MKEKNAYISALHRFVANITHIFCETKVKQAAMMSVNSVCMNRSRGSHGYEKPIWCMYRGSGYAHSGSLVPI